MGVIYINEQDPFDCCGIPSQVWEPPPEPAMEEPIPGASRRNWVYREMAMLGADASPGLEAISWLENIAPR